MTSPTPDRPAAQAGAPQTVEDVVKAAVGELAPDEIPFFDTLLAEYCRDPKGVRRGRPEADRPGGFGFEDATLLVENTILALDIVWKYVSQALDKKRGTKRADRRISQTEVRSTPVPALQPDAAEAVTKQLVAGLGAEPDTREAAVVEVVVSVLLRSER